MPQSHPQPCARLGRRPPLTCIGEVLVDFLPLPLAAAGAGPATPPAPLDDPQAVAGLSRAPGTGSDAGRGLPPTTGPGMDRATGPARSQEAPGSLAGPVAFGAWPGGAPANVAVGTARLGWPTAFIGRVSTDYFGRRLRRHLEAEGVDVAGLLDIDAPSTLAFVADDAGEPAFTFYGEGAADTRLRLEDLSTSLLDRTAALHFGGISLLRGETPAAVEAAVERLAGRALLSFDPNPRPALLRGADVSAYRARLDRLVGLADLVKLSVADCAWLCPELAPEAAARRLLDRGAGLVALTRGAAGAMLLSGRARVDVPAHRVPVVDTVGAGDVFAAGLLVALLERGVADRAGLRALGRDDLTACGRFAAAAAGLACARAGVDPPHRPELDRALHTDQPPAPSPSAQPG